MSVGNESVRSPGGALGTVRNLAGLVVDDVGVSDARPPLVFLHGLTFDRRMWQPALVALSQTDPGRRALAFDLPGHGESPGWESYDMVSLAEGIHRAVQEAGLFEPVMVGHSFAAIIAGTYADQFPTRGVVNVDQPLQIAAFATFLQSIADQLRGPAFPMLWEQIAASMHVELLPPSAQQLARSTSNPRQDLVLGYWREVLERPVSDLAELASAGLAALRAADVPYLIIAGSDPEPEYREWLGTVLPQAAITVLGGSGHFPHLAHPDRFAECLAATAQWGATAQTTP